MKIQQTPPYNPAMGVRTSPTRVYMYAPAKYLTEDFGRFKDYKIHITKSYINDKLSQKLFYVTDSAGKWIKSKLKYFEDGKWKITRSENKCLNG